MFVAAMAVGGEGTGLGVGVNVAVAVGVVVGLAVGVDEGLWVGVGRDLGAGAAERLPSPIRPHAAAAKHAIAMSRLIRPMRASTPPIRGVAQITRWRPFLSMNDISFAFSSYWRSDFDPSINNWNAFSVLIDQRDQFLSYVIATTGIAMRSSRRLRRKDLRTFAVYPVELHFEWFRL